MSQPVTVRLAEPSAEALRFLARKEHRSVSEVGGRLIEEGIRQNRFPYIEFRSFNGERHACIKGALQVWQAIMVAKGYEMNAEKAASHLCLKPEQVQAAISYYQSYPAEIDQALEENHIGEERLRQMFPNLRVFTVPAQGEEQTA
jgi:uncharacterized protein (DUF433 family)